MSNSIQYIAEIERPKEAVQLMCYRVSHPLREQVFVTVKSRPQEFILAAETDGVEFVVWNGETPTGNGEIVTANRDDSIEIKGLLPYQWPHIEADGRLRALGVMIGPNSDYTIQLSHLGFRFGSVRELFRHDQSVPMSAGALQFGAGRFTWAFSTDISSITDVDHRALESATADLEISFAQEVGRWLRTLGLTSPTVDRRSQQNPVISSVISRYRRDKSGTPSFQDSNGDSSV